MEGEGFTVGIEMVAEDAESLIETR